MATKKIQVDATDGIRCVHCGTPNPDRGDVCGNCGEYPFLCEGEEETFPFNPRLLHRNQAPAETKIR